MDKIYIDINGVNFGILLKSYREAVADGKDRFPFEGDMLNTESAGYLIERVEIQLTENFTEGSC